MPLFALFFVLTVLSSVGLPGLNGFVGEYLILLGTFETSPLLAAVATSGVVFGAVYLLMATRRVLFGPLVRDENKGLADLGARELALLIPLVLMTFVIGIAPRPFLERIDPAVRGVLERVEHAGWAAGVGLRPVGNGEEPPALEPHVAEAGT
jgi:NADH-quinone oxidoreductase subunit M